jgi:hypothetical protein
MAMIDDGAQFYSHAGEWFRGVWIPAPENILDADYTADLAQKRLLSGKTQLRLAQQTTAGWTSGGYADQARESIEEGEVEPTDPEDEEEEATPTARGRAKGKKRR